MGTPHTPAGLRPAPDTRPGARGQSPRTLQLCALAVLLALLPRIAFAQTYPAYTLDSRSVPVPIPQPYVRDMVFDGYGTEVGTLGAPKDLFVDGDDDLWIVDAAKDRVVELDKTARPKRVFSKELGLKGPQGVFVAEGGDLYVADTENARVVHADPSGKLVREYKRPEVPSLASDRAWRPSKVVVDRRGYLYVLEEGSSAGIVVIDAEGQFRGFFGATRLTFDLNRLFVNLFATPEQKKQIYTPEPVPHSNLSLTPDGFVYSVVSSAAEDQIQKLNPVGINVFKPTDDHQKFGEVRLIGGKMIRPGFVDLAVDRFGVVSALEIVSARIYQYDQSRKLLAVFGGQGTGEEELQHPASIAVDSEGRLYVLDDKRNAVYRLRPTRFAQLIHEASQLYYDGRYEQAAQLWREVLKYDAQYEPAHAGIGKAERRREDYLAAMDEFRLAHDRDGYSTAFREYRYEWLRANFGVFVGGLVAVVVAAYLVLRAARRLLGRKLARTRSASGVQGGALAGPLAHLWGVLRDPVDTFWELRDGGTLWIVPAMLALACAVRVLSLWLLAFHMLKNPEMKNFVDYLSPSNLVTYYLLNEADPDQITPILECVRVLVPWMAWVVVSYGVGVIFDGEASFAAVLRSSAYCLAPYVLFTLPLVLLGHVLTRDERALYELGMSVVYTWCALLFFLQLHVVHDFDLGKALRMGATSLFGMTVLFGFGGLLYLVTSQMVRFGWEVVYELGTL